MIKTKYFIDQYKQLVVMLGLIALLAACGGEKKPDEDLQAAFKLHQEAIKVRQETQDQLDKLAVSSDSLFMETYKTTLDSIKLSLKDWDEQLIEVPGFEEEHDHSGHDHDHDHDHDEVPELNPKQHLDVQRHLLNEIKAIAEDVNQMK